MWRSYRDFPFVDISVYDEATAEYVDLVKHVSGVVEVVCFGGVSSPGISDIDIITVVDDDAKINPSDLSNASLRLRPNGSVWAHEVSVLPKSMWGDLHSIAYCSRMDLQLGNLDVQQPLLDKNELFVTMFDGLMDRLICISRMLSNDVCNIREVLLVLHSLKHTIRLCERAGIKFDQTHVGLLDEIQDIRSNWFRKKKPELLYDLSRRFLASFYSLARAASSSFCKVIEKVKEMDLAPTIQIDMDTYVSFSCQDSSDVVLAKKRVPLLVRSVSLRKIFISLPINVYWRYFLPYLEAMNKNNSSSFIDWKSLPDLPSVAFEDALEQAVFRRYAAIAKHLSFLRYMGFSFGTLHPTAFLPVSLARHGFRAQCKRSVHQLLTNIFFR